MTLSLRDRAMFALAAALWAAGMTLCQAISRAIPVDPSAAVLAAVGLTAFFCALLYHWKIGLGFLGAAVLVGLVALFFRRETLAEDAAFWREQLDFVSNFFFRGYPPEERGGILLLATAGTLSLFAALFAFRLRWVLPLVLGGIFGMMLEWSMGDRAAIIGLVPTFAGCVMMLALDGRERKVPRAERRPPPRSIWQNGLVALVVAVVCAASALWLVPQDTEGMRIPAVERALDGVNDILADYTGFVRPHTQFSIGSVGFMPLETRLGGPVELSDEDALKVSSTQPRYLRGAVRNYYTGQSWVDTAGLRTYLFDNPFIADRQAELLDQDVPPAGAFDRRFGRNMEMTIEHVGYFYNTMFSAGRVLEVDPANEQVIVNFDEKGELFAKRPLWPGERYNLRVLAPYIGESTFDSFLRNLYDNERVTAMFEGQPITDIEARPPMSDEQRARMNRHFLFLYEGLPRSVIETAWQVTAGAANDYEKAKMLRDFLEDNFTYTLEPVVPPEDEDFVAHFLETREGYCTYFASAMAVMARAVGLPSRYVEGFQLEGSSYNGENWTVSQDQAHAWAEIFLEGIGWLVFDATPSPFEESEGDLSWTPSPYEPEYESDATLDLDDAPEDGFGQFMLRIPFWVWPIAAAILLAALVLGLIGAYHRRWDTAHVLGKYPNRVECLSLIWADTLSALELMGLGIRDGQTPYTFARGVDEILDNPEGKLHSTAEALVRVRFGQIAPTEREVLRALDYRGEVDEQLKHSMGHVRFFFRRVLKVMVGDGLRRLLNKTHKTS